MISFFLVVKFSIFTKILFFFLDQSELSSIKVSCKYRTYPLVGNISSILFESRLRSSKIFNRTTRTSSSLQTAPGVPGTYSDAWPRETSNSKIVDESSFIFEIQSAYATGDGQISIFYCESFRPLKHLSEV